jgi:signal transduction histidine kinase
MSWGQPSVRTRHLTVVVAVVLLAVGTLAAFNAWQLMSVDLGSRTENARLIAGLLSEFAQQAIDRKPTLDREVAIRDDPSVTSLLNASTSTAGDFDYVAIVSLEGATIKESDPNGLRQQTGRITPAESFAHKRWIGQLSELWQHDRIVQFTSEFKISNKPFVRIVSGVSARSLRAGGDAIRVSAIAALTIAGFALMAAIAGSNIVLRPLRELLQSIKQLEAESKAQGDSEASDTGSDLQLISNRIRELGRRFAGSRNEVEVMREQLEKVVGTVSQRVLLLDRNRHIILASPEAERLLNGGRMLQRGSPLSSVLSVEHPLNQLTERAFNLHQSLQQTTEVKSNGEGPTALMASVQLFEDHGRPAGALLTLSDSKQIETFVDFAARQFQLNRITSGVAHEIKNPLHALVLHLELINAKLDSGLDPRPHVEILTNEVHRLKRVVQTLLDFTRPVELVRHRIDANLLVREVIALAADARAQGVEIVGRYSAEPIHILADTDLLQQAILNIVINGCQAMLDGGKLIIEVSPTGDRQVEISIRDFGPGIREEDREKIFHLYYTTKVNGSGIGLAQAFRAVQLHDGDLSVEAPEGGGALFRLVLPKA